jgi:hypothetical protein
MGSRTITTTRRKTITTEIAQQKRARKRTMRCIHMFVFLVETKPLLIGLGEET